MLENSEKVCTKCKQLKSFDSFYKDKGTKSGLGSRCKECVKTCAKESQLNNAEFRQDYLKKYEAENKEKIISNRRIYRENNLDYFREYHRNYSVNRRKADLKTRVKHNVRNRLWCAFKNKNWKKDGSEKLLGSDYDTVIAHIESLFTENMSWNNYGRCVEGDCDNYWHIDHIISLNTASTKEAMEELCHYTNLQPLWASDNLRKPKDL